VARDETRVSASDVEKEHLAEVNGLAQAAYLFAVIVGAFLLMVALIALLGSTV
jgi:hypothetical protein